MQSVARIDLGIKLPYYLNSSFLDFFWVKKWLISYLVTNITKKSNLSQTKNRKSYQSYHHNAQIFFGKLQILARIEPCLQGSKQLLCLWKYWYSFLWSGSVSTGFPGSSAPADPGSLPSRWHPGEQASCTCSWSSKDCRSNQSFDWRQSSRP